MGKGDHWQAVCQGPGRSAKVRGFPLRLRRYRLFHLSLYFIIAQRVHSLVPIVLGCVELFNTCLSLLEPGPILRARNLLPSEEPGFFLEEAGVLTWSISCSPI
jgi:hypothetical protein